MNKKDKELDEFFAGLKEPTDTSEQPLAPLIAMPGPNKYVPAQRTQPHLRVQGAPKGYSMQDGYSTYDLTSSGTHHPMGAHPAMAAVAGPVLGSPQPQMAAPMNANEAVLTRISQANGGGTPVIDPTVRVPDAIINGQPAAFPASTGSAVSQVVEIPSFNPATVIAQDAPPESDVGQLHTIRGPFQTGTGGVVMDSAGRPITSPNATDSYYALLDHNGAYVQPQRAQQGAPGKGAGGK